MANEYWKKTLSGRVSAAYQKILNAARSFTRDIELGEIQQEDIKKAFVAVLDDHPELFYVSPEYQFSGKRGLFSTAYEMQLDFIYNRISTFKCNEAIEKVKRELHPKITAVKTDEEKEKIVCEYFIDNFTYQIDNRYNQNAGTLFTQKVGQCSGFARGLKLLFDWIGIECIVVTGTAKANGARDSHAWNIAKIDGNYYHLDVTAMVCSNKKGSKPYFFCIYNQADNQMTDYVWNKSQTPHCVTETTIPTPVKTVPYQSTPFQQYQSVPLPNSSYSQPAPLPSQNYSGLKVIKSMTEFRTYFEDELKKGNKKITFLSEIFAPDTNALIRSISSSYQMVCRKLGVSGQIRLSIADKVITLEFI